MVVTHWQNLVLIFILDIQCYNTTTKTLYFCEVFTHKFILLLLLPVGIKNRPNKLSLLFIFFACVTEMLYRRENMHTRTEILFKTVWDPVSTCSNLMCFALHALYVFFSLSPSLEPMHNPIILIKSCILIIYVVFQGQKSEKRKK